jgi:polysaccharide biosynthesis protein PslG
MRATRVAKAVATALAGSALLAPAAGVGAVAAVQDDQLSVVPAEAIEARLNLVAATGARVTRVDLLWSAIAPTKPRDPSDPNDPAYQFTRADLIMQGLLARGITPIVCVYSSPRWATGGKGTPRGSVLGVNPNFPNPAQFGLFMAAVAKRYSGSFSDGQYGFLPRVKNFEIWNEPNLARFMVPQYRGKKPVAATNYAKLVRASYARIKRANPGATVIAGATGPKSTTDRTGAGSLAWIQAMQKAKLRFDAYSQHIYPFAPPLAKTQAFPGWYTLPRLMAEVNKLRRGMPLYITEAGYTTARTQFRRTKVSLTQQRNYLKQIYNLKATRSSRVPVVVWFNLQDNRYWPGGLLKANGQAKPSLAAFRGLALRGALSPRLRP